MKLKDLLSFDLKTIIIIVLAILLFFQGCGDGCKNPFSGTTTKSDTTIKIKRDTTFITDTFQLPPKTVTIYKTTKPDNIPAPSKNCDSLNKQYVDLATKHYSKNIYKDSTLLKDSSGRVVAQVNTVDTVKENQLLPRSVTYSLNIPVITNTITTIITNTVVEKPKNQFYVGIGLSGTMLQPIDGIDIELTLKTKKNQMYGLEIGLEKYPGIPQLQPQVSLSRQWLIKLRK